VDGEDLVIKAGPLATGELPAKSGPAQLRFHPAFTVKMAQFPPPRMTLGPK